MNYRHFTDTLGQRFGYAGPVQLHLQSDGPRTLLDIWVSDLWDERRSDAVVAELFASYEPLQWPRPRCRSCCAFAACPMPTLCATPPAASSSMSATTAPEPEPCLLPRPRLGELLAFVRAHSPFYKDFYAAVPQAVRG